MDSRDALRDLFAYDVWANRRVNATLGADVPPNARELLGHVLVAQELWMDRVDGKPPAQSAAGDPDTTDFTQAIEHAHGRIASLLDGADEAALDRVIAYADLKGNEHTTPLRAILLHVAHHGTYHRAQIARSLREAGHVPPRTDFIVYARETEASQ